MLDRLPSSQMLARGFGSAPCRPLHRAIYNTATCLPQSESSERDWVSERGSKVEAVVFHRNKKGALALSLLTRPTVVQCERETPQGIKTGDGSKWGPFWRLATTNVGILP